MEFLTVRFDGVASDGERASVEANARARGGSVEWKTSQRIERTYGLVSLPGDGEVAGLCAGVPAVARPTAIIALAVFPSVPEALPLVESAFGGAGRPAAVVACERVENGVVLEWDPSVLSAATVMALLDAELARFRSGRNAELLSPLPAPVVAQIAAESLQAPEVGPDRELETLLERGGFYHA